MTDYIVEYEFKTDSLGRKYALHHDLRTDKRERVPYDIAHTRQTANISRRKRDVIGAEIKKEGVESTYGEYKTEYKKVEKKIIDDRIRKNETPLSAGVLKAKVKKIVITQKLGIKSRFNYAWTWSEKKYYKEGGIIKFECETNFFSAGGRSANGNEFKEYIKIVEDAFNRIPTKKDLCYLDGGSCVTLYNKSDKTIINKFQQGRGCGFSFDFKKDGEGTYSNDNNLLDEPDKVDL
jgi:hypothetical protein